MKVMEMSLFILLKKSILLQGVIKPVAFSGCYLTLNQGTTIRERMVLFPPFLC